MADKYLSFSQSLIGGRICSVLGLPVPPALKRNNDIHTIVNNVFIGGCDEHIVSSQVELAIGKSLHTLAPSKENLVDGLVFDATALATSEQSDTLYAFFNQHLRFMANCGKIVVIGLEPSTCTSTKQATIQRGLIGFIKSIAKEVGRKGITANLLYVQKEIDTGIQSPLRFFLSYRSSFVNGQVVSTTPYNENLTCNWKRPLEKKVALVTGASRGIGLAIAKVLARDGAQVIGLDIPSAQEQLKQEMLAIGATPLVANITERAAPNYIDEQLEQLVGGIDIVVHNAGITRDKMMVKMSTEQWQQVLSVNLTSIERINQELLDNDRINNGGRIICVSSISGIAGNLGQSNYAMSKASVVGLVESMSAPLSVKNITINAVAPGFIETQMTSKIPLLTRFAGRRMCALSQGGLPIDVAETVSFFAAPQSQAISANLLRVCGLNIMGA